MPTLSSLDKKQYAGRYEALLYEKNGKRQSGESMITYISRKTISLQASGTSCPRVTQQLQGILSSSRRPFGFQAS